jgi:hypothetical protein
MKRKQAERCTPEHTELHIRRQRTLGEQMVGDYDKPSRWDLLATISIVMLIVVGSMRGWW